MAVLKAVGEANAAFSPVNRCILNVVKTAGVVAEGSVSKSTTAWQSAGSPLPASSLTGIMFAAGSAEYHPSPSMDVNTCRLTLESGVMPAGVDCARRRLADAIMHAMMDSLASCLRWILEISAIYILGH